MQIDEPIFRSVQQAIHFSFMMETLPVSQKSQMHQLFMLAERRLSNLDTIERSTIRFGALNPLEVRGQCAMVRGAVKDHLTDSERQVIHARYAYQKVKAEAVRYVRDISQPSLSCQSEWATLAMAWAVFGTEQQRSGLTTRAIADEFKLSQSMVARDTKEIKRIARLHESQAYDKLHELFAKSGLIDCV
jgi:hypothetical protein